MQLRQPRSNRISELKQNVRDQALEVIDFLQSNPGEAVLQQYPSRAHQLVVRSALENCGIIATLCNGDEKLVVTFTDAETPLSAYSIE